MLPESHLTALRIVADRLADQPITWAVAAGCGLALQGIAVEVHDLDIQTDAPGAYALAALWPEHIVRPIRQSHTDRIQSHYGMLRLAGVDVDIMGDVQYRRADGSWVAPAPFLAHRHMIRYGDLWLPVLALRYELEAYRSIGRTAKVALLEAAIGP